VDCTLCRVFSSDFWYSALATELITLAIPAPAMVPAMPMKEPRNAAVIAARAVATNWVTVMAGLGLSVVDGWALGLVSCEVMILLVRGRWWCPAPSVGFNMADARDVPPVH
jgi:hypothetical protein